MEHEDNNTQFDNNYLRGNYDEFSLQHNQQNLVENLQNASGFGAGGMVGVVDEIGSVGGGGVCIGGKFDEEEHDEEEWKYIQEVQQSEKQQQKQQKMLKVGEEIGDGVGGMDDYNEDEGRDEQILLPTSEYEEEELAIIKNDGDFSTTSNTTSTPVGDDENSAPAEEVEEEAEPRQHKAAIDGDVAAQLWSQVGMEKEVVKELPGNEKNSLETVVESSLATGENCENLPQQQKCFGEQHETLMEKIDNYMFSSSVPLFAGASSIEKKEEEIEETEAELKHQADKENTDPAIVATAAVVDPLEDMDYAAMSRTEPEDQSLRPSELDLEMHSNLNPDAKEFVPIFSNPTSPISPVKTNDIFSVESSEEKPIEPDASPVIDFGVGDKNEIHETHDDFGNNDNKTENDIDDCLMGNDGVVGEPALSASSVSPHPNAVPRHLIGTDAVADDVVAQSPRKGRGLDMDEISLPAVNDFELEANERPHEIEQEDIVVVDDGDCDGDGDGDGEGDVRNEAENTNATNKFIENGENLDHEEGDASIHFVGTGHHVEMSTSNDYTDFKHPLDHGPETSVDLDMDSQDVMKQSFYIENSAVNLMNAHEDEDEVQDTNLKQPIEELLNTVQPIPTDPESIDNSFDDLLIEVAQPEKCASPATSELQFTDFPSEKEAKELVTPSSPYSTEEKHLVEETKERLNLDNDMNEVEQKMDDLILEHDSNLQQVNDVAQIATTIKEEEIASLVQESEMIQPQHQEESLFAANKIEASSPSPLLETMDHQRHDNLDQPYNDNEDHHHHDNEDHHHYDNEDDHHHDNEDHHHHGNEDHHLHENEDLRRHDNEDQHLHFNQDIAAQFEDLIHPNESQIQVEEVSSSLQETIFPADVGTVMRAEPLVEKNEAPSILEDVFAPAPANDTLSTPEEDATILPSAPTSEPEKSVANDSAATTEIAAAAAIAATAATAVTVAAVAAVASSNEKPIEPVKKTSVGKTSTSTSTTKSKTSTTVDVKKTSENKKPTATKTSTLAANARPRTAPSTTAAKTATAGASEKKTSATTAKSATHAMSARKPLTNSVAAAKPAAKASTARPTTLVSTTKAASTGTTTAKNSVSAKTPAPRPATSTLAPRKTLTTTTASAPTHSATAAAAAKPRPLSVGAPTKPSTLNITNKPKAALSPRSTLTSQLRKTGPTSVASTVKSPIKTATTPTTNGIAKQSQTASTSTTNRTKTTTTTTTTTTKTFTARPAPKTTSTLTTTTTLNTTTRRATTGSAAKPSSNPIQRKLSPSKPSTAALGGKVSPSKTNVISKNKTKDVTTPKSVGKTTVAAKEIQTELKGKQMLAGEDLVELPKLNGNSCNATGEPLEHTENGGIHEHYTHEENGSIEQGEMALMDGTAA